MSDESCIDNGGSRDGAGLHAASSAARIRAWSASSNSGDSRHNSVALALVRFHSEKSSSVRSGPDIGYPESFAKMMRRSAWPFSKPRSGCVTGRSENALTLT